MRGIRKPCQKKALRSLKIESVTIYLSVDCSELVILCFRWCASKEKRRFCTKNRTRAANRRDSMKKRSLKKCKVFKAFSGLFYFQNPCYRYFRELSFGIYHVFGCLDSSWIPYHETPSLIEGTSLDQKPPQKRYQHRLELTPTVFHR